MLIPKNYLDAVVSIEIADNGKTKCIATGFICGFLTGEKDASGQDLYKTYLVTNRHVFRDKKTILLRFNTADASKRYPINLRNGNGDEIWSAHPNPQVDVAVLPVHPGNLKSDGVSLEWVSEENMLFKHNMEKEGVAQGDGIFILGYPMGISGGLKNYVITRGGIIARLDDEILENEHSFLIDALIFPGNSGGPVFIKPEVVSIQGTKAVNKAYLIGLVKAYLPYTETAYSLQTDPPQPRIEFRENSGLAFVVPMDYVIEIINLLMPKNSITPGQKESQSEEDK